MRENLSLNFISDPFVSRMIILYPDLDPDSTKFRVRPDPDQDPHQSRSVPIPKTSFSDLNVYIFISFLT